MAIEDLKNDLMNSFMGKDYYQDLIDRADTIPLIRVFKHYGIRLDEHNKKITCPFKAHRGGRESTPSFYFYPDTNSFYCFGCHIGGKSSHGCLFMSEMDRLTKVRAAYKLLELFAEDVDEDNIHNQNNFSERLKIMMEFSDAVREFYQTYSSKEARVYVEMICEGFDSLNLKHKNLDNTALSRAVEDAKRFMSLYKG